MTFDFVSEVEVEGSCRYLGGYLMCLLVAGSVSVYLMLTMASSWVDTKETIQTFIEFCRLFNKYICIFLLAKWIQ